MTSVRSARLTHIFSLLNLKQQILRLQKKQEAMRQAGGANNENNKHETRTAVAAAN